MRTRFEKPPTWVEMARLGAKTPLDSLSRAWEELVLTESQLVALERGQKEKKAHGDFIGEHPGYFGAQNTFYVSNLKDVGRIYQQTSIDTYSKVAVAKLYDRTTAVIAADMLNDRVVPMYTESDISPLRVLTEGGPEYWGKPDNHAYELYLALEHIEYTRTKVRNPHTNGICERFHKTLLDEFYKTAFRKKIYTGLDMLLRDFDGWVDEYHTIDLITADGAGAKRRYRRGIRHWASRMRKTSSCKTLRSLKFN